MPGQAKLRQVLSGRAVIFDFNKPDLLLFKRDRETFSEQLGADNVIAAGTKLVIAAIVAERFAAGGMDTTDGDVWAAWLEALDDGKTGPQEVTVGMLNWLLKQVKEGKVVPPHAQWRLAVREYIEQLVAEAAAPAAPTGG